MSEVLRSWRRRRMTTYLAEDNVMFLQQLAKNTGMPMGKLIDQALDNFFSDIAEREPATTHADEGHLKKAGKSIKK